MQQYRFAAKQFLLFEKMLQDSAPMRNALITKHRIGFLMCGTSENINVRDFHKKKQREKNKKPDNFVHVINNQQPEWPTAELSGFHQQARIAAFQKNPKDKMYKINCTCYWSRIWELLYTFWIANMFMKKAFQKSCWLTFSWCQSWFLISYFFKLKKHQKTKNINVLAGNGSQSKTFCKRMQFWLRTSRNELSFSIFGCIQWMTRF